MINIDLICGTRDMEEILLKILDDINKHHEEESNTRSDLYKVRQKIEALNLTITVKNSHYEVSDKDRNNIFFNDIEASKVQLKKLLINEDRKSVG